MSVVVGIIDSANKRVILGADTLESSAELCETAYNMHKIFRSPINQDIVIGTCGSVRNIDTLQYNTELFANVEASAIDRKYIITKVIPKLKEIVDRDINAYAESKGGIGMLIGVQDRLYEIQTDYAVLEKREYSAIGSGALLSYGSLFTTSQMSMTDVRTRIIIAVRAAMMHTPFVGGSIDSMDTLGNTNTDKANALWGFTKVYGEKV